MKVALCTSEAVPFAKTGGLADVCGALPLALEDLVSEIIVVMPKYKSVRCSRSIIKSLDEDFDCAVIGSRARVFFVKSDAYLRHGLYGNGSGDYADNPKRFSHLCLKTLELFRKIAFKPDVIHCHDWQTALIPALQKAFVQKHSRAQTRTPKTLLTIHNVSYQGVFPKQEFCHTTLSEDFFSISGFEFYGQLNFLKGGIQYADMLNTVSPAYARQIQTKEFGCGLEGVLAQKRDRLFGIINGLDYSVWNPQADANIFKNYSGANLEDKKINKVKLQEACGLLKNPKTPLLGFVGRLVEQKGVDMIIAALPHFCRRGLEIIILGRGDAKYEAALQEAGRRYRTQVFFCSDFNDALAHRIYAGADIFLMPSTFEPCGIGQLISFKYGTVPLVHNTGGLRDTVIDYDAPGNNGSGFLYQNHTLQEFLSALERALILFADEKKWRQLAARIMRLNFSWKESARGYVELYEKALRG